MKPRGQLVHAVCQCCGRPFTARQADRKRGWAKACGKSCAARLRERRGLPMPRPVAGLDEDHGRLRTDGPEFDFVDVPHGDL